MNSLSDQALPSDLIPLKLAARLVDGEGAGAVGSAVVGSSGSS